MASPAQKAFCVLEFKKCHSVITVQRRFRQRYNQEPPNANNIRRCPPHWSTEVRTFLNQHLPKRWIGRCRQCLLLLATEISGLDTLRFFFLWGYVKDRVYMPPMPKTIEEIKVCICNALASVTEQMLQNVWREMDYRLDVVRVTKGSHIEHLRCMYTKF
ncbi:hypothetical protein AVEN_249937-1 [Araneus ventricosus]|uniref:Uncharacterized protein n=1 Tax=Araneus ventricosus TaxID=182803 RepID=A0A4Y2D9W9_ARAVE|nr:hypothetical protein AVEN_249937-1 [Araneus ventricosus]